MSTAPGDPNEAALVRPHSTSINESDLDLAKAVATSGSALDRIRQNAADWRTGLAGLLTIVTTALVFKPPEKVSVYPICAQFCLGALALGAAVSGAIGLWLLLKAAHGDIKEVTAAEVEEKGGYEDWVADQTEEAARHLQHGRRLTAVSASLVGGLIGISWFIPPVSSPPAYVRVTEMGEALPLCGTLQVADAKGVTFKIEGQRDDHTTPFAKLVSVVLVDKCP